MLVKTSPRAAIRRGVLGEAIHVLQRRTREELAEELDPLIERLEHAFDSGELEEEVRGVAPHLLGEVRRVHWLRDAALVALRRLRERPRRMPRRNALLALRALECAERALVFRTYWVDTGGEG